LRGLFLLMFLEVSAVGLIAARLPLLLTTEFAKQQQQQQQPSLAYHGPGRCLPAAGWLPPTKAQVAANVTARAPPCAGEQRGRRSVSAAGAGAGQAEGPAPCCTAGGTLAYPDACPPGSSALATAPPGNNYYSPHAQTCALGNAAAARVQSRSDAALLLLTFLCSPAVGTWSDLSGRRPVLLAAQVRQLECTHSVGVDRLTPPAPPSTPPQLAQLGPALVLALWAWAPPGQGGAVPISLYFVARALTGSVSSLACCLAYVADVVQAPPRRAAAFGLLLAVSALGVVAAPLGARLEPRGLATAALAVQVLCVALAGCGLRESLPPEQRQANAAARASRASAAAAAAAGGSGAGAGAGAGALRCVEEGRRALVAGLRLCGRTALHRRLTAVLVLGGAANRGLQDLTSYFLLADFGFDAQLLGALLLLLGVMLLLVQGLLLPRLLARVQEVGVLLLACGACVAYHLGVISMAIGTLDWLRFTYGFES
jgi:drug/metabolite transporter (DMT)-like permease